jgi:hypothetical protein
MPVTKYRRGEDMPAPSAAASQSLATRICAVWNRALLLSPARIEPGVVRFRSIEESNARRTAERRARMMRSR